MSFHSGDPTNSASWLALFNERFVRAFSTFTKYACVIPACSAKARCESPDLIRRSRMFSAKARISMLGSVESTGKRAMGKSLASQVSEGFKDISCSAISFGVPSFQRTIQARHCAVTRAYAATAANALPCFASSQAVPVSTLRVADAGPSALRLQPERVALTCTNTRFSALVGSELRKCNRVLVGIALPSRPDWSYPCRSLLRRLNRATRCACPSLRYGLRCAVPSPALLCVTGPSGPHRRRYR